MSTYALMRQRSSSEPHGYVMVEDSGIEPLTEACKATVFPIIPIPQTIGSGGGNRTPTNGFGDRRTAIILHRNKFQHTETNVCIKAFFMDEPTCP